MFVISYTNRRQDGSPHGVVFTTGAEFAESVQSEGYWRLDANTSVWLVPGTVEA